MFYLAGYILACLALVTGLGALLATLYKRSSLRPTETAEQTPPPVRAHALISFSLILPFSALAFAALNFAAMKIARAQGQEGHLKFVVGSLFLPTVCFLCGYFYFNKAVRS